MTPPSPRPTGAGESVRVDSASLADSCASLGEQLLEGAAWFEEVASSPGIAVALEGPVRSVVLLGTGDAAVPGSICAALTAPLSPVPVIAVEGSRLPVFVGPGDLVVAIGTASGDPDGGETASAAATAAERGARVVVLADPGATPSLAGTPGAALLEISLVTARARGALGLLVAPLLLLAARAGVLPGAHEAIEAAAAQTRRRRDDVVAQGGGVARALARRLARTMPLVVASPGIGSVAARRFKSAMNENAKSPAWAASDSFAYEEVCAFGQHGDVTRQITSLVVLRSAHEEPSFGARLARLDEPLREVVSGTYEVAAEGSGPLAQLLDLVLVADLTSLELAALEGIDPGPVPASEAALLTGA